MPHYDPDSRFSVSALYRLDAAGVPIMRWLFRKGTECLERAAEISLDRNPTYVMANNSRQMEMVINQWLSGKSPHPPTWGSLFDVLRELGLEKLCYGMLRHFISELHVVFLVSAKCDSCH